MINNTNTVIITTTKPYHERSHKRIENIINTFSKYNIPIIINDYVVKSGGMNNISYETTVSSMKLFQKINTEYALFCDNDLFIIDDFLDELNKTVQLLPHNWRCLHICPGYLWGRRFRDITKLGKLHPEYNMDNIKYHESGRFYIIDESDLQTYFDKKFWLGGPIAVLINKNNIDSLLNDFINGYALNKLNNDVIFTQILNKNDYVCREPQLGYENEEGGTTF
jgi:hypothetical protein